MHANRSSRLARLAIGALALTGITVGSSIWSPGSASASSLPPVVRAESEFVARVNALRVSAGLKELRVDPMLTGVAREWASELSRKNCICHHPEFETGNPEDAAEVVPGNWIRLGENVGTGSTAVQIQDAFEASPGHRKNILEPSFDSVGVGVVEVNGVLWVSQQFQDLPTNEERAALARSTSRSTADAPDELALATPRPATAAPKPSATATKASRKPAPSSAKKPVAKRRAPAPASSPGTAEVTMRTVASNGTNQS